MDENVITQDKTRINNLYILKGFTYGPLDRNSLEEARIPGVTISVKGPQGSTLISDASGNFSSGLLPEGKYALEFFDPSGKYYSPKISVFLNSDVSHPIQLYILGDKRMGEREFLGGGGNYPKNVIHGFVLERNLKPLSGMAVRVKSVLLDKQKKGTLMRVFSKITSLFKKKSYQEETGEKEEIISLELKTNKIGKFSTKKLPNGSFIVSCADPSGKYRFSSKFVVLKGNPIAPLFFTGYTQEDLEELRKKYQEQKDKTPEEREEEKKTEGKQKAEKAKQQVLQKQERARQRLEEKLRQAQAQREALQARLQGLSQASQRALRAPTKFVSQVPKFATSYGQKGAGFAGGAARGAASTGIRGAEAGTRVALMAARAALMGGSRLVILAVANPAGATVAIIVIVVILIIVLFMLLFGGGGGGGLPSIPGLSGGGGSGGTGTTPPRSASGLDYYIPFRDPSVLPTDIKNRIISNWPNAQIQNFDTIVSRSQAERWNPSFVLTLWIEESGGQGVPADDPLGCAPDRSNPNNDINVALTCLFNGFGALTNDRFADFMCRYDQGADSPCVFINQNFPKTIKSVYSTLVTPGSYGALIEVPPQGLDPLTATCPIAGGTASNVTCGSYFTLRNSCGHCRSDAGYANYMNNCTYGYEAINYAEDIGGSPGQDVFLPSINDEVIEWSLINVVPSSIGFTRHYSGINPQTHEEFWIEFHHVDSGYGVNTGKSGEVGARICTTNANCNHVHVEFSTVTRRGRIPQDAPLFLCV